MANLSSLNFKLFADISSYQSNLRKAQRSMRRFGREMQGIGSTLSLAISAPLTAIGTKAVSTFATFEAEMSKVKAISGATSDEFKALEQNAKDLGASTTFTASDVAKLQTEFAKLGFSASEITKVTESTLALAQASGSDLARSAEVAGSTLRAFQMDASETGKVTDVMAKSFSTSALDMETFAESMKYVAPVAQAAGISLEETSAMLALLANAGIKGSQAGTSLRRIISDLGSTGGDVAGAIEKLANQGLDMGGAMDEVGRSAQSALLVLAQGSKDIPTLTKNFEDADGAAKAMADTMTNNTSGAFAQLQSAMEGAMIELGQAIAKNEAFQKVLSKLTKGLGQLTKWAQGLTENELFNGVLIAGLLTAVPLLVTAVGSLTIAFGTLTAAMGPLGIITAAAVAAFMAFRKEVSETDKLINNLDEQGTLFEQQSALEKQLQDVNAEYARVAEWAKKDQMSNYDTQLNQLYADRIALQERLGQIKKQIGDQATQYSREETANQQGAIDKGKEETEVLGRKKEGVISLNAKMGELGNTMQELNLIPPIQPFDEKAELRAMRLKNAAEDMAQGMSGAIRAAAKDMIIGMSAIVGAMAVGEASFRDLSSFLLGGFADLLRSLGEQFVEYGLQMYAFQIAALTMNPALAIAAGVALIAAAGAIQAKQAKNMSGGGFSIPMMAEGGIVTGPTLALIGEGKQSEAVIPLDKLDAMMSGGNGSQAVEVFGRISGADILLSNERAANNRTRSRGF